MKYELEFKNGTYLETLEVNGRIAKKTWKKKDDGITSRLCSSDPVFVEQLEGVEGIDPFDLNELCGVFEHSTIIDDMDEVWETE